jgi:hypothetical protein
MWYIETFNCIFFTVYTNMSVIMLSIVQWEFFSLSVINLTERHYDKGHYIEFHCAE